MLERRRNPELVPSYSLTGDLLSFTRCGLQYRYLNGSALPPSRPVQLWFGEFIHGVMETAYRTWLSSKPPFPWPCTPTKYNEPPPSGRLGHDIGTIGDLVEASLAAAGKVPRSKDLRNSGYERARLAVNELGPALFPMIHSAEERVIGTRPMPSLATSRAKMYELHGVMDVLSILDSSMSPGNIFHKALRAAVPNLPNSAEIIVDYKGSDRPSKSHKYWDEGAWQIQMYAWLRSRQPAATSTAAGVLIYVNELGPSVSTITALKRQISQGQTDVSPASGSPDDYLLRTWGPGSAVPAFSLDFRLRRAIRVVPINTHSIDIAVGEFDKVVARIESCVAHEARHGTIMEHWPKDGDDPTCDACDFRHFCPSPASARKDPTYKPPGPSAP